MFKSIRSRAVVAWLAAVGTCLPWHVATANQPNDNRQGFFTLDHSAVAAESTSLRVADVALAPGGVLTGQVVDDTGRPLTNVKVALVQGTDLLQTVATDQAGVFEVANVQGGTYELAVGGNAHLIRAWAPHTAPPSAKSAAMVVHSNQVIRGQQQCGCGDPVGCSECVPGQAYGGRPVVNWMQANPGLVLAGVAAAIAIPIAIVVADDDDPPPATP